MSAPIESAAHVFSDEPFARKLLTVSVGMRSWTRYSGVLIGSSHRPRMRFKTMKASARFSMAMTSWLVARAKASVWHSHADTDDLFLVLKGVLKVEMRDRTVALKAGEMYIVPKGVEHRTVAEERDHARVVRTFRAG